MTVLDRVVGRPTRRVAVALVGLFGLVAVGGFGAAVALLVASSPRVVVAADPEAVFALRADPVAVGTGAADLELGAGYLWVSNRDDGTITRIDPATGATTTISVGGQPGQLVVADGAVWVRNLGDRITRVDVASGAVSPPIATGGGPVGGMAVVGGTVWVSHRTEGTVSRVDARTLVVVGAPIDVGEGPSTMETDGRSVFLLENGDGTMSRIDARSATINATVPLGERLGGVEIDQGTVYVAVDDDVVPVDAATMTRGAPVDLDDWSYFVVHDGILWVVFDDDPGFQRYDVATRALVGDRVPGPGNEVGRARLDGDTLWFTLPGRRQLSALVPGS